MTAAKIMDIISRLPGFAGQAADAVSAYTQVKMEVAHKLLKIPKSGVTISYGTIKYVVVSNQNNTEIPADPPEDQVPQTSIKGVAARSKAKAKPQQREPVDTTTTMPMHKRIWIDIEPSEQTLAAYDLSKKVISLLRLNQTEQREEEGAIQFYRIKFYLRNHSSEVQHWSDDRSVLL